MAKVLWNVRYRGAYNPGDGRDGVKLGMFWVEEQESAEETEKRARAAADAWKAQNPDVHFIIAVWPAVLFSDEVLVEPEKVEPVRLTRPVAPIPAGRV